VIPYRGVHPGQGSRQDHRRVRLGTAQRAGRDPGVDQRHPAADDRVFGAIERLDLHDRIVDALRKGATAELGSLYAADASFAVRDPADDQGRFHRPPARPR